MKTWKHISEDNRKTICSCISHNKKLIEISKIINYDPRAISKEVKRTSKPVDYADQLKVNVLNLIAGHMFVLIVKTDIKIALSLSLYMIQRLLKEKLMLILLILEKVLT